MPDGYMTALWQWLATVVGRPVLRPDPGDDGSAQVADVLTGRYQPTDRMVVALEPSREMIGQRLQRTHRVVRRIAEQQPFADATFDASLAVFTVHHWTDREAGLSELRRVSKRQVVLFFEPLVVHQVLGGGLLRGDQGVAVGAERSERAPALLPVREGADGLGLSGLRRWLRCGVLRTA